MNEWEKRLLESPRVEAFRRWLLKTIPVAKNDSTSLEYLQTGGLQEPLFAYLNWVRRLIPPRRRQWIDAWQWPGMRSIPLKMYSQHANDIENLRRDIVAGVDVNHRISKKVRVGFSRGTSNIGWVSRAGGDKDFFLNAYGLHHIHLRKSADTLIYCAIDKQRLLFIHLGDHEFHSSDLDDAITRWRDVQGLELKLVEPDREPWSHRDRRRVELSGGSVIRSYENRALMGAMLTSSGHSVECIRCGDDIIGIIEHFEKLIQSGKFEASGFESDGSGASYLMYYSDFYLHEPTTGKNYLLREGWL